MPELMISLSADVWVAIQITPAYVPLTGTFDTSIEKVVEIKANKEEPLTLKIVSNSIEDKAAVELKAVQKDKQYELIFKNKVQTAQVYNGEIKLTTNYKEKPEIVIPVRGNIMAYVKVRPDSLNFGRFSESRVQELSKAKNSSAQRPVMVVANIGEDLEVKKVEVEKSTFKIESKVVTPGRMVQILVEPIFLKMKPGKNEDMLKIYTNKKGCEIMEVPLLFEQVK